VPLAPTLPIRPMGLMGPTGPRAIVAQDRKKCSSLASKWQWIPVGAFAGNRPSPGRREHTIMMPSSSLERYTDSVARAQEHWQRRAHDKTQETKPAITVALAREAGVLGTTVARAVAGRLHWQVYDQELVELIAHDLGLRPALLASVDERHKSWL